MQEVTEIQSQEFKSFLDSHQYFMIIGHKEPDGDCVSSSLGVSYILDHFKKQYILLNAGPFKRTEIKDFQQYFTFQVPFMSNEDLKKTGLIIVDCSELSRLGEFDFDFSLLDTFIIDHHKTASAEGKWKIVDPDTPAASILVQQLYEKLVGKPTPEHANTLFYGTATDTGFFKFCNQDSSKVFNGAARLVDAGVNPREIYQKMTSGKPYSTRKLLAQLLFKAERYLNGKLVVSYETMDDSKKYGQEGRDSDAFYSLMLATEGVEAVVFVRQESEFNCTIGFRSVRDCDCSIVASKFGGGGHKNASGASTEGRVENLIPQIVKEFSAIL